MNELARKVNAACTARGDAAAMLAIFGADDPRTQETYKEAMQTQYDLVAWIEANYERKAVAQ